jgi:hypothetical protein
MLAVMALLMVSLAVPAFAQGKFEQGLDKANSICAASGLNDNPDEAFPDNGRTQSYGQIVSKLVKIGVNVNSGPGRAEPGTFCNGHLFPYPEAFPPPAP